MSSHGRLNLFQRLVRQWDAIHPYNAAQAIRIQGRADIPAIRIAWHGALEMLGLGRAHVTRDRFYFEHLNGQLPRDVVQHVTGEALETFLSRELNHRFDEHDVCPFRPFAIDEGDDHIIGVVYHHWVADGVSIRALLRQWFLCQHDAERARREPVRLATNGYWSLFGPHAGRWRLGDGVLNGLRWTSRFRRVRRMKLADAAQLAQAVTIRRAEDGLVDCLRDVARSAGVTLHDLLLAAAAEACDRHLPMHRHGRRHDLAMGAIVDLRPHARTDLSDTFGMFLGFTTTLCRADDLHDWPQLLRAVSAQNRLHKEAGHSQSSVLRMAAGLVAGRVLPREKMVDFYRKRVPLAGGTSNVNLAGTWAAEYHPSPVLEYLRFSPTGPIMPLVFSTTTLGRRFNLCLTRRSAVVDEEMTDQILDTIFARLDRTIRCGNPFAAHSARG